MTYPYPTYTLEQAEQYPLRYEIDPDFPPLFHAGELEKELFYERVYQQCTLRRQNEYYHERKYRPVRYTTQRCNLYFCPRCRVKTRV